MRTSLEESTYVGYAPDIRLHVAPISGGIRLQELTSRTSTPSTGRTPRLDGRVAALGG